ncbi:hypothetical protein [Pseudotamlana carrageenivorans]|uniref:Peptidase n=1 Tax=Pseudotamlana carrageenivorans TaxID=2069432 RepID=A0A2I7SKX2_9FLAO|nr:hypothetical protein [Tamlana carrageenivorans]AUS06474.1 hypothetical protein C1A40_13925 [Tamlana carrageenivorans]
MTHKFIVNTEEVNEYGYRILTSGIDTAQYMRNPIVLFGHERALHSNPQAVIGKVVKLYVEDKKLIAEIEFDESEEFAKKVAKKVEGGFIRMASLYADVIEASTDAALALPGQTHETVIKCKLVEISIVDIGGNDGALKLSRNGAPIVLKKIESKINDMSLKTIALALSLKDSATDVEVLQEVNALKLAKEKAENKALEHEQALKDLRSKDAKDLVDKAVALGLLPEALKASQISAFESDFDGQKAVLTKIISDKEAETVQDGTQQKIKEVSLASGSGKKPELDNTECFDYLQKHDVVKLAKIREESPEKYAQLAKEYANGKRYVAN